MSSKPRPNYLVHAPAYDPTSGGSIFLHMLVHRLNELGEEAAIWPWYRDPQPGLLAGIRSLVRKPSLLLGYGAKFLNPTLDTPLADYSDLQSDTIVIYPEIRLGNPLGLRNVVRWLLYTPGVQHPYRFGEHELFFCVGPMFDLPQVTGGAHELAIWRMDPAYRNLQRPDRKGACYQVRKGSEKPRIAETEGAICIDGKSHEEVAEIFNASEVFYSYDEASFYSQYAAICGCLSIVVPGEYASPEHFRELNELFRCGIAYGLDDLPHARATAHLVEGLLVDKERQGLETVRQFIRLTQERFG